MTEKISNNSLRSKLTLKLPTSVNNQSNQISKNSSENKKYNSSAVQVTIKGRKKESKAVNKNNSGLNNSEFEARIKAVTESFNKNEENEIKTHSILNKINKDKKLKLSEKNKNNLENKNLVEDDDSNKPQEINTNLSVNNFEFKDEFNVLNKIKESVAISNRQKEEREKVLEERKKLENEKNEKEKKKSKKQIIENKSFQEDEIKKKNNFKEEKVNVRKLTYIIDSEDGNPEGFSFRRRKSKIKKQQEIISAPKEYKKISREVTLPDLIIVSELADRMSEKAGDVVKKLFSMGMVVTSNQAIDAETAEIIINEFGHTIKRVSHSDVENILQEKEQNLELLPRAPIVTIMGHVDHGKTSLLDALRETDVASREHGGITQHIGASRIQTKDKKFITFLDTPGHEAFTEMRSRGANVTDIVVLVVAADDGVKEQTVEAINHAKAANVPIIVAVNKIDKPGSNPDIVKNELLSYQLVAEDLGGDVMFIPVSAKSKTNLDKLEEAILLQAEILELKAPYLGKSNGVVIESRVNSSKGVIATLLVQNGSLDVGDLIVVGTSYGKIRKMSDDNGRAVDVATPSVPVEVLGLNNVPNAGDKFVEVDEEKQAREIIAYRLRNEKEKKNLKNSAKSITDIFKESGKGKLKYLNVIIKGDVHGSVEAINNSISKLGNDEVAIKVIHQATGGILESDVNLASASDAIIIGFNVRASLTAKELANNKSIDIRYYSIIYNLVDDLKLILSGLLSPIKNEEYLGQAEIRQVFKITGVGKIAGAFVIDGIIKRSAKVRLLRENIVIFEGILKTLKRFKDDVKEVKSGFECGVAFENFDDIKEKDIIECYQINEQKRSII